MKQNRFLTAHGFTLAELLISLSILGVIATFTIPKVLQSQQDSKFNAIGKEAAAMIAGAYQSYRLNNTVSANTAPTALTPYMNYVAVDTTTVLDDAPTSGSFACGSGSSHVFCLRLHNGAILEYYDTAAFGGTGTTNAMFFYLDPDGQYSNTTNGPGKSVVFFLYYSGKIRTWGSIEPNTYVDIYGGTTYTPNTAFDPSWFSWN